MSNKHQFGIESDGKSEFRWTNRQTVPLGALPQKGFSKPKLTLVHTVFVGNCTGNSAGFAPLRMRSTYPAARRNWSTTSIP
jgi:hypothetical protein